MNWIKIDWNHYTCKRKYWVRLYDESPSARERHYVGFISDGHHIKGRVTAPYITLLLERATGWLKENDFTVFLDEMDPPRL